MGAVSTQTSTIAQPKLAKKVADGVLSGNILALKLLSNPETFYGTQIEKSHQYRTSGNGKVFTGQALFNTNEVATKIKLTFVKTAIEQPIVLVGTDLTAVQSDPNRAVDYIKEKREEATNELLDALGTQFYGDGTATDSFVGLDAIVDNGSLVATYGGQARATYTSLNGNRYAVTGIQLSDIATAEAAARRGSDRVNLHVTSDTYFNDFEALLMPTLSHQVDPRVYVTRDGFAAPTAALSGHAGFMGLAYKGIPIVADQRIPANRWYGLNTDHLKWAAVQEVGPGYKKVMVGKNTEIEGVYNDKMGESYSFGLGYSDFIMSENQYTMKAHLILEGCIYSALPNRHFKLVVS